MTVSLYRAFETEEDQAHNAAVASQGNVFIDPGLSEQMRLTMIYYTLTTDLPHSPDGKPVLLDQAGNPVELTPELVSELRGSRGDCADWCWSPEAREALRSIGTNWTEVTGG